MSQDKELEIQMQFLEEATDYLNTLESVLLELNSSHRIDPQKINAALRAAHSIKGGAAMMGFQTLSDLAHRLEDSFKVLKTQRDLVIDPDLQGLLLDGVDWLRQVVELQSEGNAVDSQWLQTFCYPVFEQLHERLGEPAPEDANTMLGPEEGQEDIIPLIFQTEVEGCLQRLEAVLADPDLPCLEEEVSIMAAELGGLGEMLQIESFTLLCESVTNQLATYPDRVQEITRLALQAWRRSQALAIINQLDSLPTEIDLSLLDTDSLPTQIDFSVLDTDSLPTEIAPPILDTPSVSPQIQTLPAPEFQEVRATSEDWQEETWQEEVTAANFEPFEIAEEAEVFTDAPVVELTPKPQEFHTTDYKYVEPQAEPAKATNKGESENTVRVPVKQLEQINDLFGELTIERNGINLQLERLRKLIRSLNQRVKTLDRENMQLRTAYDKISTQSGVISVTSAKANNQGDGNSSNPLPSINSRFDALEMDRYNELHQLSQSVMETIVQVQEVTTDVELGLEDTEHIARQINKTAKQLQTRLTQVRMRPLSDILERFPRALRELSVQHGKNVQLKVEGGNTLIERNILEALNDPLMHLLRNSFDHGIEDPATRRSNGKSEQGLIEIRATHRSNRTIITVRDDGRGISLEKIRSRALDMGLDASLLAAANDEELLSLIFEPGFSTKDEVTALSGRGVGMDVVRSNLRKVRGEITVKTQHLVGTTFTLSVPFTLSVARVVLVESNQMLLAFPTDAIAEMLLLVPDKVISMGGTEVINWQGQMLQFIRLGRWLQFNCRRKGAAPLETPPAINAPSILIINQGNQQVALQVDRCWGEQEVAIRRVEGDIPMPSGFSNCTILGDGRVVPLVSSNDLLHWIASTEQVPGTKLLASPQLKTPTLPPNQKGTILIVDDSINVRRFLALTLEKAGYRVEQAKDGQDGLEKLLAGLHVQAVICDIEMPRLDGYGFLGRVKSNTNLKHLSVAMLTSRSSDKHRQLAMQLGATAYFSKPYNEQDLLQTLEQIIFEPQEAVTAN